MKRCITFLIIFVVVALYVSSCKKAGHQSENVPHLPATLYDYVSVTVIPPGNPYGGGNPDDNSPQCNPVTNAGATLGRVLFYEPMLSVNNSVSCGSCHKQQYAFSDNVAFSQGYNGQKGTRNALPMFNEFMNSGFFWDGRVNTLESQVLMPVKNHVEMGLEDMTNLVTKLKSVSYYPPLFQAAFGTTEISAQRITYALSQFVRTTKTFNTRFDQGASSNFSNFSALEREGEALFRQFKCNTCHGGDNLASGSGDINDYSNSGLDLGFPDPGLMDVTGNPSDNGKFKIPSLRNIAVTGPYMHDGRFATLEDVIDHYSTGVQPNPNLDFRLTQAGWGISTSNAPVVMNLTAEQKQALVAFLNTLTDYQLISDPKFSDPFK